MLSPNQCRLPTHGLGLWARRAGCIAWACAIGALGAGCSQVTGGGTALPAIGQAVAPTSVLLDIFTVRVPPDDPDLREALWAEVDEQQFSSDTRRRWAANGLRAGVLGTQPPARLERLLRLTEASEKSAEPTNETRVDNFEHEPPVRRKLQQIQGGRKLQITLVGEGERLPSLAVLLRSDEGSVSGRTYHKVLGQLQVTAVPEGDGRARLEIVPELEHGEPQRRFEPGEGSLRVEVRPDRMLFESLHLESRLSPGQFLLLSCVPDRPGTLGHQLFTEKRGERTVQKLVLIRLAHSQYDDLFDGDVLPLSP